MSDMDIQKSIRNIQRHGNEIVKNAVVELITELSPEDKATLTKHLIFNVLTLQGPLSVDDWKSVVTVSEMFNSEVIKELNNYNPGYEHWHQRMFWQKALNHVRDTISAIKAALDERAGQKRCWHEYSRRYADCHDCRQEKSAEAYYTR